MIATIPDGVHYGMSFSDYLSAPAVSKSALDKLADCPAAYRDATPTEQTPDMLFGTLAHALVLEDRADFITEPETFVNPKTGEIEDWSNRKTYCQQWKAEQTKPVLPYSTASQLHSLDDAVQQHPHSARLLTNGRAEVSIFATLNGIQFKGRCDWLNLDEKYVVDLKTTRNASTDAFAREICNRRYHVQAALYLRILTALGYPDFDFYFIAVQKSNPPRLNVRKLKSTSVDLGAEQLDRDIELLLKCQSEQSWPDYSGSGEIQEISVPDWAFMAMQEPMDLNIGGETVRV